VQPAHAQHTVHATGLIVCVLASLATFLTPAVHAQTTWHVGPTKTLKTPGEAALVARDGDTVHIDAGIYTNNYARWHQDDLTIRGIDGMAHLTSNQLIPNGKGIWIVNGSRVRIENIEFSGAKVRDTNGAGIRHQGGDLSLHNTFFHDNEFSLLSGKNLNAAIEIRDSRFWFQKRENRFSHGIYIGRAGSFSISGSHILGTDEGHQLKSRALRNHITYNRIEDGKDGNSSRLIDLPNCGLSLIMGNDLHQGAHTGEEEIIGYGAEGCENRGATYQTLLVTHNTVINDARRGVLVRNYSDEQAQVNNNLVFGKLRELRGLGKTGSNIQLPKNGNSESPWEAPGTQAIVDLAMEVKLNGEIVFPTYSFSSPIGITPRTATKILDIGAREWVTSPDSK
jgi:Right handed beta helix region